MKKVLVIFGAIISASLIFALINDAKACSEIFISKSGKENVSACIGDITELVVRNVKKTTG